MRSLSAAVSLLLAVGACASDTGEESRRIVETSTTSTAAPTTTTAAMATTSTSTAAPSTTTTATASTTTTSTTTTPASSTTSSTASAFSSSVAVVGAGELGDSWREGCPVPVEALRALRLTHWNDFGDAVDGVLVVHHDHVDDLIAVFASMFDAGFPIASMRPVSEFGADDDLSMAADNTSAFNCREVAGRPGVWSQHSYGTAVDVNPLRNPFVSGSTVDPPTGAPFADRGLDEPGMIRSGDAVTSAFASIGWGWGGNWRSSKDYQHFSANGR